MSTSPTIIKTNHGRPNRQQRMEAALREAFAPNQLDVVDESHQHAGHSGASPLGETHYRVRIASSRLSGLSRINAHRMINITVASEFQTGLHALAIEVLG